MLNNRWRVFCLILVVALDLQLTSQLATFLVGVSQWVTPVALVGLISHGFLIETGLAFCIGSLVAVSVIGISKMNSVFFAVRIRESAQMCHWA